MDGSILLAIAIVTVFGLPSLVGLFIRNHMAWVYYDKDTYPFKTKFGVHFWKPHRGQLRRSKINVLGIHYVLLGRVELSKVPRGIEEDLLPGWFKRIDAVKEASHIKNKTI